MSTIRAVLLDMGGVVLDTEDTRGFPVDRLDWRGRQALLRRVSPAGAVDLDELDRLVFEPWRREYQRRERIGREADWSPHLQQLRQRTGVKVEDIELLAEWFRPYSEHLEPFPGVAEALAELGRRGLEMVLVSNVPLPGSLYVEVLQRWQLHQYFAECFFSYDIGTRKPSPAMLRRALRYLERGLDQAIMVGDRRNADIAAGRAAGVRTVWIRSDDGGGPAADETIDSLAELPSLLRRWP